MAVPMPVLRVVTDVPAVVVSGVLMLVALALVPEPWDWLLLVSLAVVLAVLASGGLERPAVAVLTWARPARPAELRLLMPSLGRLVAASAAVDVLVRRRRRGGASLVTVVGRRSVLLAPELLDSIGDRTLNLDEVAALVIHAHGVSTGMGRHEVAVMAATAPWRGIRCLCCFVAGSSSKIPAARAAWALRGVIALVCVVQAVGEGSPVLGVSAGLLVALTYLVPAASATRDAQLTAVGDRAVVGEGLGQTLLLLLQRHGVVLSVERRERLTNVIEHTRPTLRLVPGLL